MVANYFGKFVWNGIILQMNLKHHMCKELEAQKLWHIGIGHSLLKSHLEKSLCLIEFSLENFKKTSFRLNEKSPYLSDR